ncbi:hypothetical protein FDG2_3294 [Candidatus Protofrankia californiensis]|uniref:Uncharacterized protein n=1 Tax=Candidatus Protofrankia californiensis TaxID=1839754 RepID=A0A1C3NZB6_9ACTN|nr:hypothetical protein FDG2_3294 [Candidatus Protofrankia californiensis]
MLCPTPLDLKVPFGFGTVRHELREHVERTGRATIVSGVQVRSTDLWKSPRHVSMIFSL